MSKAVIIKVSLADSTTNPPTLKLTDSEGHTSKDGDMTTFVEPGAIVSWTADKASGIAAVVKVQKTTKPFEHNDYVELIDWGNGKEGRYPNGDVYATIKSPSVGKGKEEEYTIFFTIDGDTTIYTHDPKLKMNN